MWTVFHLVSLYPVSAGPRLILFSWTTSKPLIRYPLQAYSSCLFAFGYLLAKVARKGVIGERLIRCFRSALTFPPVPPRHRMLLPSRQMPRLTRSKLPKLTSLHFIWGGPGGGWWRGGMAKAAGQTLQTPLSHASSPCSTNSGRGYAAMCASREVLHANLYAFMYWEIEKCYCAATEFCNSGASV